MDNSSLNELILLSKRNDHQAFRKIVEYYQSKIYSLAFRLMSDDDDAKDIAQETFLRVWMHLSGFDTQRKFSTWIYAIATNLCLDKLKSPKHCYRSVMLDDSLNELISSENVEQNLINSELSNIILALTNDLTNKQKIVFTLRDIEELEVEEITQITGLSANKIKSNLFLARQAIRNKLKNL